MHEDDARALLLATADPSNPALPDEPHWFAPVAAAASAPGSRGGHHQHQQHQLQPQALSHEARAVRLWLYNRCGAIRGLEEVLRARLGPGGADPAATSGHGLDARTALLRHLADEYLVRAGGGRRALLLRCIVESSAH